MHEQTELEITTQHCLLAWLKLAFISLSAKTTKQRKKYLALKWSIYNLVAQFWKSFPRKPNNLEIQIQTLTFNKTLVPMSEVRLYHRQLINKKVSVALSVKLTIFYKFIYPSRNFVKFYIITHNYIITEPRQPRQKFLFPNVNLSLGEVSGD
jgi:hypothetical protein